MTDKTLEEQIRTRLSDAVKALFKPPVLVGPQWLKACPNRRPADFQYFGMPKVAKASGKQLPRVIEKILRHANLETLGVTVEVTGTGLLNINEKGKPAPAKKAAPKPAEKPAQKPVEPTAKPVATSTPAQIAAEQTAAEVAAMLSGCRASIGTREEAGPTDEDEQAHANDSAPALGSLGEAGTMPQEATAPPAEEIAATPQAGDDETPPEDEAAEASKAPAKKRTRKAPATPRKRTAKKES